MKFDRLLCFACSIGLTVGVGGCVRYKPAPLSASESASRLGQRSLADEGLRQFIERHGPHPPETWPPAAWDLDLLTLAAFYYDPGLEVARAQWRSAQAGSQTAAERPNPTVTAGPGYNSDALKGVTPWMPFVNLDMPLETAGKRGLRQAQARQFSEAARLQLAVAGWTARIRVRSALLALAAARARQEVLEPTLALHERLAHSLEQRVQAGAISRQELAPARVALERVRVEIAGARRQEAEALSGLAEALGVPGAAIRELKFVFELSPPSESAFPLLVAEARREALRSRSDVLAALAEYAASESTLQLEIAKQYPDLHLSPGYQLDQGESKWQLGLSAALPVFNQNKGKIGEAEARRAETGARFLQVQARVLAEIDRAASIFEVSGRNLAALRSLRTAEDRQREAVEEQVRAGAADPLDLLNAQVAFNAGEIARLDAQIQWAQALGALEDAVQRPLPLASAVLENVTSQTQSPRNDKP